MEDFTFESFEFGEMGSMGTSDKLETEHMPGSRNALKRSARHRFRRDLRVKELEVLFPEMEAGYVYHVISGGRFDSFNFAPMLFRRFGVIREYWFTTWALNRDNVVDMLGMFDRGEIGGIHAFVGTYLKRRETAVYGLLLKGLQERGQRMKAFKNHTKVQVFRMGGIDIVVEGSANLTANHNCENFVVSVGAGDLADFHCGWLEEMMDK